MNLLMISGDRALAIGKQGAFYNTLSELHKHFERIDIICPRVPVRRYDMVLFGNVHVHPSPWSLFLQPLWILYKGRRIFRQLKIENSKLQIITTVHEYAPFYNGLGARLLNMSTHIPYILEVHHVPGFPRAASSKESLYRWLTKHFIAWDSKKACGIRVVNIHEAPEFLISAGVPRDKILVVPSVYLDTDIFRPIVNIKKKYDVAFVGRMTKNKGLNLFLDVLELTGLVGVAVGDGPLMPWLRKEAKRRKLKFHITGFVRDSAEVAKYLNESRLLLMTSLNEGGPRVVIESLACGTPVVATPVGIVPDILPPEAIEEWDVRLISDKVKNVLNDPMLYSRLRESGLEVSQNYDIKRSVLLYADKLKGIV